MDVNTKNKKMKLLSYFLLTPLVFVLNFCSNQSGDGESRDAVLAEQ